jgi:hypothetical protein
LNHAVEAHLARQLLYPGKPHGAALFLANRGDRVLWNARGKLRVEHLECSRRYLASSARHIIHTDPPVSRSG